MWIWLVVALLAAIGEVLTFDLFLASVAAAAVVVAGLMAISPFTASLAFQVSLFAGLSLLGIAVVRPVIKRALGIESLAQDTGALTQVHLVGRQGVVTRAVDASGGQIRIGHSEFWTARSFDPDVTLAPGETVDVLLVDGISTLVGRAPLPASQSVLGADGPFSPREKGMES